MSTPILAADSICKRFGQRQVLSSASLWATPGRIVALAGRNGCGKTTLLRVAAGQLPADAGAVHFAGRCRERPRLAQLAREGLFFLPARDLLPLGHSVRASLQWLAAAFGTSGRIAAALAELQLEGLADARPYELSGGERRRAELAAVLVRAPRCLLADEPFVGLEPLAAELVAGAFQRLRESGCAVVVTGHESRTLLGLADDVIWLTAGTTHVLGTPEAARAHDFFRRDYLGPGA